MNLTIAVFVAVDYRNVDFCRIDHFFAPDTPPISFDELLISNMAQRRVEMIDYHFGTFITVSGSGHEYEYKKGIVILRMSLQVTWKIIMIAFDFRCNVDRIADRKRAEFALMGRIFASFEMSKEVSDTPLCPSRFILLSLDFFFFFKCRTVFKA